MMWFRNLFAGSAKSKDPEEVLREEVGANPEDDGAETMLIEAEREGTEHPEYG